MKYIRYSQFDKNEDGNPLEFTNKKTFYSHKTRREKLKAVVIFSNIDKNGKIINKNIPANEIFNNPESDSKIGMLFHNTYC